MDKLYRAGDKDTRPNEFNYMAVFNHSCAFPANLDQKFQKKALDTAIFTVAELQALVYGKSNHLMYGTFLKAACAHLMPRYDKFWRMVVKPVFLQCCKDGQVGEMVLKHLQAVVPKNLYWELLKDVVSPGTTTTVQDLPHSWQCYWPGQKWAAVRRGKHVARQKLGRFAP
jgi:hypothetical protein